MNSRKKRYLEREINNQLYRNLSKEGITLEHLDPTRLKNWPFITYPAKDDDYINLLPPSYRDPFGKPATVDQSQKPAPPPQKRPNLRESLALEWQPPSLPAESVSPKKASRVINLLPLLITIASALVAGSLLF